MTILMTIFDDNFWWQFLMTFFDDNFWWQFLMTIWHFIDCDHYQSHEHLENVLEETFRHIFQVFLWLVMVTVMTHHMRASLLRTSIMPIFKSLSKKSFENSVYFTMTILIPTTLIKILTLELENLNSWQSFWPDN